MRTTNRMHSWPRRRLLPFALLCLMLALLLPFGISAQRPQRQAPDAIKRSGLRLPSGEQIEVGSLLPRGEQPKKPVTVMVELEQAPVLVVWSQMQAGIAQANAKNAAQAQAQAITQAQAQARTQIEQLGGTVLFTLQRTLNGLAVSITPDKLKDLAKLPGVTALRPVPRLSIDHSTSVPLIGAPHLWGGAGLPLTGEGIKIGVIDTGVDYLHTNFGGSGLQSDYDDNDTTTIGDVDFPNAKVAGGYDFAGDNYDPEANVPPAPDPDPMDCNGHGSHVAGSAAGYGVKLDGTTYEGPWNVSVVPTATMRIGSGVAPEAQIYALRVFGCDGSTDLADAAIEWATDPNGDFDFSDHLDVINLSLGSDFGDNFDSTSAAVNNAALAGVVVVASAGNSSDTFYITGSPGTADWAISVAASADSSAVYGGFEVTSPPTMTGEYAAGLGVLYDWESNGPTAGELSYPPTQRDGCAAFNAGNVAVITGTIVLLDWTEGGCGSVTRGANARAAGAIGMILADDSEVFDLSINGSPFIPSISIDDDTGAFLKAGLDSGATVNLILDDVYEVMVVDDSLTDQLASFSSRGPRRGDSALKPDISAPGLTVYSTASGTGDEGVSFGGTSMAAPHVAGSMALLKQLHPTWKVQDLKALIMNTANNLAADANANLYSPSRQGAGRVTLQDASVSEVVAYNRDQPGLVSLSFGAPEVTADDYMLKSIRLANKGSRSTQYEVTFEEVVYSDGVAIDLPVTTVTVPAYSSANVPVGVEITRDALDRTLDPATDDEGGLGNYLNEHSGYVVFTPAVDSFSAVLLGGNEVGPPTRTTDAMGTAFVTYNPDTNVLTYDLEMSDITGVSAAHFHVGAPGVNGGVIVHVCGGGGAPPSQPCNDNSLSGVALLPEVNEAALYAGGLYLNVHTPTYPGGEMRGQVMPTPAIKVPYYIAPRAASELTALGSLAFDENDTDASLEIRGQDLSASLDYAPYYSAFELHEQNPNDSWTTGVVESADMKHIGVSSTLTSTNVATVTGHLLYFGISTYAPWSTPSEVEFDIYIDSDLDGFSDYIVFNWNLAQAFGGADADDILVSVVYDLNLRKFVGDLQLLNNTLPAADEPALFNSNTMIIPVAMMDVGLHTPDSRFEYAVVSFHRNYDGPADLTNVYSYNPGVPALRADATLEYEWDTQLIDVYADLDSWAIENPKGLLLFHHLNAFPNKEQVISATAVIPEPPTVPVYLPMVRAQ